MLAKEFARKIKALRGDKSQEWLSEQIGVSRATVNRWEGGAAGSVTLDELEATARIFDRDAWEMIQEKRPGDKIPGDLLAAIERMDASNYAQLRLIVDGFLRAEGKLEARSDDHQSRQKLK